MSSTTSIEIEFDEETQCYYIVWEHLIISSGDTPQDALKDLKETAHFAVEILIDLKLSDIRVGGKTKFQESLRKSQT